MIESNGVYFSIVSASAQRWDYFFLQVGELRNTDYTFWCEQVIITRKSAVGRHQPFFWTGTPAFFRSESNGAFRSGRLPLPVKGEITWSSNHHVRLRLEAPRQFQSGLISGVPRENANLWLAFGADVSTSALKYSQIVNLLHSFSYPLSFLKKLLQLTILYFWHCQSAGI